jgi:hypothetical protein
MSAEKTVKIDKITYGTVPTREVLHITGGLRAQRAGGGWIIGPLFTNGPGPRLVRSQMKILVQRVESSVNLYSVPTRRARLIRSCLVESGARCWAYR